MEKIDEYFLMIMSRSLISGSEHAKGTVAFGGARAAYSIHLQMMSAVSSTDSP